MGRFCYCDPCEPNAVNQSCELKPGSKCFAAVELIRENEQRIEVWSYGCLRPNEQTILQCHGNLVPHTKPTSIECCDETDLCNEHLRPTYVETTTPPMPGKLIYHGCPLKDIKESSYFICNRRLSARILTH